VKKAHYSGASPLLGSCKGTESAGQRYRIIYTVEEDEVIVLVVYVGMR
jgi:hypothetical protein